MSSPVPTAPVPGPAADPLAAARTRLEGVEALPPAEQVPAFDAVHQLLQQSLAAVDQSQRDNRQS